MKNMYTWAARPVRRNLTVADMRAAKGVRKLVQVTANSEEEASAAAAAGLDLIICNAVNVDAVRRGNDELFLTAALGLPDYPTESDILRGAFGALERGADAVMTARSLDVVSMLAKEEIPIMGHLGLIPRKSTWIGGLRAVGKTADEAFELYRRFRRLEEAGAFSVEAEVIPGPVLAEISRRSGLVTVSLGSGVGGDVMYLFMQDICGDADAAPRHARAYADLAGLRRRVRDERIRALKMFREDALGGGFPGEAETVGMDRREMEGFLDRLERDGP